MSPFDDWPETRPYEFRRSRIEPPRMNVRLRWFVWGMVGWAIAGGLGIWVGSALHG
jgi:hypothetical protein